MHWSLDPHLPTSGIREILNHAISRPGTLRLETGEPDFPPPPHILEAFARASQDGKNRYTATEGILALREALVEKLREVNQVHRTIDQILVTPGGIPGLFLAFLGTATSGDEILIPDPGWPDYLGGMMSLGIKPVAYSLKAPDYYPDVDALDTLVTPRTRAIVLNFPSNPTGRILPPQQVEPLVHWAERHGLWIISDEVYDQIVFDGSVESPARLAPERTLAVYSFSKTYAMTGWRLGYLTGPTPAIQSLTRVAMGAWSSVSEPLQYAGLSALTGPQTAVTVMRDAYRVRRDMARTMLGAGRVVTSQPNGAFYLLADIAATGLTSRDFAFQLLDDEGVAVAPGSAFGREAEGWVRISLASSEETLQMGLQRLIHRVQRLSQ